MFLARRVGRLRGTVVGVDPAAEGLRETWQFAVLAAAAIALLIARRGIVVTLLGAGIVGTVIALAGGPVPR